MAFPDEQLVALKEAEATGDPEKRAAILVQTGFEGPGTFKENIDALADRAVHADPE